jgi:hypothetical protein
MEDGRGDIGIVGGYLPDPFGTIVGRDTNEADKRR